MSQLLPPELEELVSLYAKVKRLVLEAEQLDLEQQSNIAIIKEQSYALDHLMRYLGDLFDGAPQGEDYRSGNYRAVRAHLCRVGFDALDDLGISLKLRINRAIENHSNDAIVGAIPQYYREFVPELVQIDQRIEESRARKDVGSFELGDLKIYEEFVMRLIHITVQIEMAVPAMVAFEEGVGRCDFLIARITSIRKSVESFSNDAITSVIPDYFTQYVGELGRIGTGISKWKCVEESERRTMTNLTACEKDLEQIAVVLEKAVPAMQAFEKNQRRWKFRWRDAWWYLVGAVVVAVITVLVEKWLGR